MDVIDPITGQTVATSDSEGNLISPITGKVIFVLSGMDDGVTLDQVIAKIAELAAAKNHTHNPSEILWLPTPVLPGEYYLIRREEYAHGCLRTDSYVESGDPPMPELVSVFSAPKVLPIAVSYVVQHHEGAMPLVIDPSTVSTSWAVGDHLYVDTPVVALNGDISSWLYLDSAKNYGVYLLSRSPELFWDFGEQAYILRLHIKKTIGETSGMIEYADQMKLLADEQITGEVHLLPGNLGLHEDAALDYWTDYYPTMGGDCPAYKVVEE